MWMKKEKRDQRLIEEKFIGGSITTSKKFESEREAKRT